VLLQAQNFDSIEIKTTKLTNSIYMMEGSGGNIGLCTGPDGAFIIDDQFAPLTAKILKAIAKVTDKPVQFVINTHWHFDHSGGNENLGKEGAIIVSQENSRRRMQADQFLGSPQQKQTAYSSAGLPKITFAESMNFYYNDETIRVFHIADAHTDGDAIIYFEKSNVVHMGDVFVRYGLPFIDEPNGGNVNGMITTIDSVLKRINANTTIIPGHGQLSKKQDLEDYNKMLKTIRDRVKTQIDKGKTFDQIVDSDPTKGFEKRGVDVKEFVKVVYDSILKSGKNKRK
jgi:glyoxylase-like metal-dependent hydrolase (beta-lactamase superfamily II)